MSLLAIDLSSRKYFLSTAINDVNVIIMTVWILKFFELKQIPWDLPG